MKTIKLNPNKNLLLASITIILFALNGCAKEDVENIYPKIYRYDIKSMFYPELVRPDTTVVELVYDEKNRIVHRIGNLIATGMMYKFYKGLGDTVIYYNDSIIIMKHLLTNKDFTGIDTYKRKLFLENGVIVKEIHKMEFYGYRNEHDTVLYFYNGQNQIIRTTHSYNSNREYNCYNYDEKGNLVFISADTYYIDYLGNSTKTFIDTTWFLDYDNAPNLAKDLIIFEECYYRALSANNFRKYIKKNYAISSDTFLYTTEKRSWDLMYDENNYPIY